MKSFMTVGNKKALMAFCLGWCINFIAPASLAAHTVYKDKEKPIDVRVKDLLKRMTLEEKIAQLQTIFNPFPDVHL